MVTIAEVGIVISVCTQNANVFWVKHYKEKTGGLPPQWEPSALVWLTFWQLVAIIFCTTTPTFKELLSASMEEMDKLGQILYEQLKEPQATRYTDEE